MFNRVEIQNYLINPLPHAIGYASYKFINTSAASDMAKNDEINLNYMRFMIMRHKDDELIVNLVGILRYTNNWKNALSLVFTKVEYFTLSVWYSDETTIMNSLSKEEKQFFDSGMKD